MKVKCLTGRVCYTRTMVTMLSLLHFRLPIFCIALLERRRGSTAVGIKALLVKIVPAWNCRDNGCSSRHPRLINLLHHCYVCITALCI